MEAKNARIAWNRIIIDYPDSWQARVTGFFSLVFEADFQPLYQVRWQAGRFTDQDSALSRVFSDLTPVDMGTAIPSHWKDLAIRFADLNLFANEGGVVSGGYFSVAPPNITVLFQILNTTESSQQETASTLCTLSALSDEEPTPWKLDSYSFSSPPGMKLRSYRFDPGRTLLIFDGKQETIEICRLTAAGQRLKTHTLSEILQTLTATKGTIKNTSPGFCELSITPSAIRGWLLRLKRKKPFLRAALYHDGSRDQLRCIQMHSRQYVSRQDFFQTNSIYGIIPQENKTTATYPG